MDSIREMGEDFAVVLTIVEGRDFPISEWNEIIVNATLDENKIYTDSRPYAQNPDISTDIVWETDRVTFQALRSQKILIRVSVESESGKSIGHFVLDLKEAIPVPHLGDIDDIIERRKEWKRLLGAKKDDDKGHPSLCVILTLQPLSHSEDDEERTDIDERIEHDDDTTLKPVLNDTHGFFQIGNEKEQETFHFSVEINYASNLHLVVPEHAILGQEEKVHFSYTLFGEVISTEPFQDLVNPSFNVEEAVVKIKGSFTDVATYFRQYAEPFVISLCSENVILTWVEIDLARCLGGICELKKDEALKYDRVIPFPTASTSTSTSVPATVGVVVRLEHVGNVEWTVEKKDDVRAPAERPYDQTSCPQESQSQVPQIQSDTQDGQQPDVQQLSQKPEYRLTIDLRFLELKIPHPKTVRLSYRYPHLTDQTIDSQNFRILPHERTAIPFGTCQFTVSTDPVTFLRILKKHALFVEITDVNDDDKRLGKAKLELFKVFNVPDIEKNKKRTDFMEKVLSHKAEVGSVVCSVTLEVISNPLVKQSSPLKTSYPLDNEKRMVEAAMEMEEWKSKQKLIFKKQLQDLEYHHLNNLSAEWSKREKDREMLLQKQMNKISELETSLKNTLKMRKQVPEAKLAEKDKKIRELEELNTKLTADVRRMTQKIKDLERELNDKRTIRKTDSIDRKNREMERENADLRNRISELEKELYKQQQNKCIMELQAKVDLLTEEKEFYKKVREREQKDDLALRELLEKALRLPHESPSTYSSMNPTSSALNNDDQVRKEIRRLNRDREIILKTGDYIEEDSVIRSIDEKIINLREK